MVGVFRVEPRDALLLFERNTLKRDSLTGDGSGIAGAGPRSEWERDRDAVDPVDDTCEVKDAEWCKLGRFALGETMGPGDETRDVGREAGRDPGRLLNDAIREASALAGLSALIQLPSPPQLTRSSASEIVHRFCIRTPSLLPRPNDASPCAQVHVFCSR